uniref:CSON001191 protein n=1 Tax=Culicoides sonorensis TaxID=179676 RepID=A0A336MG51_CULSO
MESVVRIQNIPLVETGLKTAESLYNRLKQTNSLINWGFTTAESVSLAAIESIKPVVQLAEGPISKIDQVVCKSLDLVEQRVPSVYLPPEMMYWNTKEYMSDHFVRPVVKRANSVKQISNAVLMENRVSTYAAEKADSALDVADAVIEKYLPDNNQDEKDGSTAVTDNNESPVVHAFHHGQRFSKKLKRRLTVRTVAEMNALKKQSKEAVHILIYAAELIVTDPRQAVQKAKELWALLSGPEPENQARPQTLEQLIVLLTRESARRVVHLVNYTYNSVSKIPRNIQDSSREIFHHFLIATNSLIKAAHLETVKDRTVKEVNAVVARAHKKYDDLQTYGNMFLERLAIFLSGRLEAEKISPNPRRRAIRRAHNPQSSNNNPVAAIVGRNQQPTNVVNGGHHGLISNRQYLNDGVMYDDTREETEASKDLTSGDESRDEIVRSIKEDFEHHKKEHRALKDQLITLVQENKQIKDNLLAKTQNQITGKYNDDSLQTIDKLKSQIKLLTNEKQNLEELWKTSQRTVSSLETEVAHYRNQLSQPNSIYAVKQEYVRRMKEMERNIKEVQSQLDKETGINTELKRAKAEADIKSNNLESKFKEILMQKKQIIDKCMKTEIALANAKSQINALTKEKFVLENQLQMANQTIKNHISKETEAITKVQEALSLAESAIIEKDACLARERESREEVDYLARTIGQVMEEAAKKVDDDIESLRKEHAKEMERLEEILAKNKSALENQCKKTKIAESKCKEMEDRIKALSKTNMMLDNDLHKASQTIEQEHSRMCEERSRQFHDLVESSKRMKHGWKQMTLDITSKLQSKINDLQLQNRKLESENCKLKKSLMGTHKLKQMSTPSDSSSDSTNNNEDQSPAPHSQNGEISKTSANARALHCTNGFALLQAHLASSTTWSYPNAKQTKSDKVTCLICSCCFGENNRVHHFASPDFNRLC